MAPKEETEMEVEEGGTSTPPDCVTGGDGIVLRSSPRRAAARSSPRRPLEAISEEEAPRLGDGSGRAATQASCISPPGLPMLQIAHAFRHSAVQHAHELAGLATELLSKLMICSGSFLAPCC